MAAVGVADEDAVAAPVVAGELPRAVAAETTPAGAGATVVSVVPPVSSTGPPVSAPPATSRREIAPAMAATAINVPKANAINATKANASSAMEADALVARACAGVDCVGGGGATGAAATAAGAARR
ncbi:MAG: hypothetical protein M3238_06780 [Actinomycetota bacterium]|nr:hypothetical protein [Actinomycetota bacterium]